MKYRAKGFTLVELLIVIMIIAILAGLSLLAYGSSRDSVEATRIVADLRDVKSAALFYYIDENDWPMGDPLSPAAMAGINKHLDGSSAAFVAARYDGIYVKPGSANDGKIFIGLKLKGENSGGNIKRKLAATASQTALYEDGGSAHYSSGDVVYMHLR